MKQEELNHEIADRQYSIHLKKTAFRAMAVCQLCRMNREMWAGEQYVQRRMRACLKGILEDLRLRQAENKRQQAREAIKAQTHYLTKLKRYWAPYEGRR